MTWLPSHQRTVVHVLFVDLTFHTEISGRKNGQKGVVGTVTVIAAGAVVVVDGFYNAGNLTDHGCICDIVVQLIDLRLF